MDRPGLILMIYNPSKSRDRSHYEQFHGYHRRLYERVEPTTATPFAISAIQRALAGALLVWARQQSTAPVQSHSAYVAAIEEAAQILADRCSLVQVAADDARSLAELRRVTDGLLSKWRLNPQDWEEFPPSIVGEYLMLWPGQFSTPLQRDRGVTVPSSMRQVDGSAELAITQGYLAEQLAQANAAQMNDAAAGSHPDGGSD
jgi:predicted O-linked N-acetylglucosamine transferase (SPINDLY family)